MTSSGSRDKIDAIKERLDFRHILAQYHESYEEGKQKTFCFNHEDHEHPSLAVYNDGAFCHVCCEQFDIFDVYMHYNKCDFVTALKALAIEAGIELDNFDPREYAKTRKRHNDLSSVAGFYENRLWSGEGQKALDYARGRGWTDDIIKSAHLGYAVNDRELQKFLLKHGIDGSELLARDGRDFCSLQGGYEKSPDGYLIYPHYHNGKCEYLTSRSITLDTKEHRNLPGKKQLYFNSEYSPKVKKVFIVEGQACAITIAQWGYAAIGMCGSSTKLLEGVARQGAEYILIEDGDSKTKVKKIIAILGPGLKVLKLPPYVSDVNDWLQSGTNKRVFDYNVQGNAKEFFSEFIAQISVMDSGMERRQNIQEAIEMLASVQDKLARNVWYKKLLPISGMGKRDFDDLLKDAMNESGQENDGALEKDDIWRLWHERHPDTLWGLNRWRRYKDGYWPPIFEDKIVQEIHDMMTELRRSGRGPKVTSYNIKDVMELARGKLSRDVGFWDSNQDDMLVFTNGTFNLTTMQFGPHHKEYHMTQALGIEYNEDATCPNFEFALDSSVPYAKDFIQEFMGLSLTRITKYEASLWLCGPPGCGKSTIVEGVLAAMGDTATTISLARLTNSRTFRFALDSSIIGKRAIFSLESPGQYLELTETLKKLISGEIVDIEEKREKPLKARVLCHMWLATEFLPGVRRNDGLFRRARIVRMPPRPPGSQDKDLKQKILLEKEGILQFAIRGLKRLIERGEFDIPVQVRQETDTWKAYSNTPLMFLQDCCTKGEDKRIEDSQIYKAYKEWCIETGHSPKAKYNMHSEWASLGLEKEIGGGSIIWKGVELKPLNERSSYNGY